MVDHQPCPDTLLDDSHPGWLLEPDRQPDSVVDGVSNQPIVVDGDSSAGGDGIPGNLTGEGNQELIDVGIHQLDVQPGSSHDVGASAHLPISSKKRKTCPRHVETGKDMVKWVNGIPFVQSGQTGYIHSGRCKMHKVSYPDYTIVVCSHSCCVFEGQPSGGLCECLCHVFASSHNR